jgi:hypothetical protein
MSMEESRARLRASQTEPDYFWFDGADLKDLFEDVEDLGAENIQLRVYPGLDEKGYPDLHLEVIPKNEQESCGNPLNCSHVCPPDCPD